MSWSRTDVARGLQETCGAGRGRVGLAGDVWDGRWACACGGGGRGRVPQGSGRCEVRRGRGFVSSSEINQPEANAVHLTSCIVTGHTGEGRKSGMSLLARW